MANNPVTPLGRVIKSGFMNVWRNLGLSLATTFVMTLTLLAASVIVLVNLLLGVALQSVQEKVDISVYYNPLASAEQIATSRAEIENISGVAGVTFTTREEALDEFRLKHLDDPLISASLEELDENPLQSTLSIVASSPDQYESINQALEGEVDGQIVDRVNFDDNRETIERLSVISRWASYGGLLAGILLGLITVLVVYNTVRLTIFSRRDEVHIMKLVGATNGFVRGPFLIEGLLFGLLASIITISILQPAMFWLTPKVQSFFGTSSLVFTFVQDNIVLVILVELAIGALLGAASSWLAVRRYLKV